MPDELIAALAGRADPARRDGVARAQAALHARAGPDRRTSADERRTATRCATVLQRAGFRALLAVPLLREQRVVGALVIRRKRRARSRSRRS